MIAAVDLFQQFRSSLEAYRSSCGNHMFVACLWIASHTLSSGINRQFSKARNLHDPFPNQSIAYLVDYFVNKCCGIFPR